MKWVFIGLLAAAAVIRGWSQPGPPEYQEGQLVRVTTTVPWDYSPGWLRAGELGIPIREEAEPGDRLVLTGRVARRESGDYSLEAVRMDRYTDGWGRYLKPVRLMRETMLVNLGKWLPADEAALAGGILLGGSSGLSREAKEGFRNLGLLHIVAASGYNVAVVSGWLVTIGMKMWGRKLSIYIGMVCIGLYIILAGMSAPVVRAGFMAMVAMTGWLAGRASQSGWLLAVITVSMLAIRPAYWQDLSFWLSVAATAGLVWMEPVMTPRWGW